MKKYVIEFTCPICHKIFNTSRIIDNPELIERLKSELEPLVRWCPDCNVRPISIVRGIDSDESTVYQPQEIQSLVLEKMKFNASVNIPYTRLVDLGIDVITDDICDSFNCRLSAYFFANTVHTDVTETIKYPKTWWDGFKEQFFPAILKKLFPIEYSRVDKTTVVKHICPHLNLSTTKDEKNLHFAFLSQDKEKEHWVV